MSNEVKKMDVQDILDAINEANDKNVYSVYVPSLKRDVLFRELNTGQEKMLIKSVVDNPVYNTEFIFAIRQIMKENCAERDINIDDLTLIDKLAICLVMRQKSIGDEFEYVFQEEDKTKTIKISEYIERINEIEIPEKLVIERDELKVTCKYPTILTEYALEKEFRSSVKELEIKSVAEARDMLGEVFTNGVVKYIESIEVVKDGKLEVVNLDDYKFKDRVRILEKIGNKVLGEILNYIETSNKAVRNAMEIELELNKKEAEELGTKKLTSVLEASADFFIIS